MILLVSVVGHPTVLASTYPHDRLPHGQHNRQSINQLITKVTRSANQGPHSPTLMGSDVTKNAANRKWLGDEDQSMTQTSPPAVTNQMEVGRSYGRGNAVRPWAPDEMTGANAPRYQKRLRRQLSDAVKASVPHTGVIREITGDPRLKKLQHDGRRKTKTTGYPGRDVKEPPPLPSNRQGGNTLRSLPNKVFTTGRKDQNRGVVSWPTLCHSEGCSIRKWPKDLKDSEKSKLYQICPTCHWSHLAEMAGKAESSDDMNGAKEQVVNVPLATNERIRNRRYGISTPGEDGIQPSNPDQQRQPLDENAVSLPIIEKQSQSWNLTHNQWKRARTQKQHDKAPPIRGQYKERWIRLVFLGKRELDIWPMSFVTSDDNRQIYDNVWKLEKETDFWNIFAFSYPDSKRSELESVVTKPLSQKRSQFVSRFGKKSLLPNFVNPFSKRRFVMRLGKRDLSEKFPRTLWNWQRRSWNFMTRFGRREPGALFPSRFRKRNNRWVDDLFASRFGKRNASWNQDDARGSFGKRSNPLDNDKFTSRFGKRRVNGNEDNFTSRFGKRENRGAISQFASRFGKRSYRFDQDDFTSRFGKRIGNHVVAELFASRFGKRDNSWDEADLTSRFEKRGPHAVDDLFASRFGKRGNSWDEEEDTNHFGTRNDRWVGDKFSSRFGKRGDSWNKDGDFTSRFGKRNGGKNVDYFASRFGKRTGGEIEDDSSRKRDLQNNKLIFMQRFGTRNNFEKISDKVSHHDVPNEKGWKPEGQIKQVKRSHPTEQVIRIDRRSIDKKPIRGRLILLGRGQDNQHSRLPLLNHRGEPSQDCLGLVHNSSCDAPTHRERRSVIPPDNGSTLEAFQTPDGKSKLPILTTPEAIHKGSDSKPPLIGTISGQVHQHQRAKRGIFGLKKKYLRPVIRLGKKWRIGKYLSGDDSIRAKGRYQSVGRNYSGPQKRALNGRILRLGKRAKKEWKIPKAYIVAHVHGPFRKVLNNSGQRQRSLSDNLPTHEHMTTIPGDHHDALPPFKRTHSSRKSTSPDNTNHIKLSKTGGDILNNGHPRQGIKPHKNQEQIEQHWSPHDIIVRKSNSAKSEANHPSPLLPGKGKEREATEKRTNIKTRNSTHGNNVFLIEGFDEELVKAQRLPETYSKGTWDGGTAD
ncbi:uncharacterized protein LOC118403971 [Branchiostoma floridae]|uniref:Uncharacterized protein LOC118403971 n=1 Tax=Branchiostoma floridae TaxID=7739 RepID=A0A9J7KH65_BRAFL|nr:uncharacterized protein LOC118403971 [Branchiostoma floridae]